MTPDTQVVESLVQIITREVLSAYAEEEIQKSISQGLMCKRDCASGMCVTTCFNKLGQVVSAGAERITSTVGVIPSDLSMAGMIDHTLLKPDATHEQVTQLCFEARKYNFASVCVNPTYVKLCADLLQGSHVKVCSVIGFPLGATLPEVKVFEAEDGTRKRRLRDGYGRSISARSRPAIPNWSPAISAGWWPPGTQPEHSSR